MGTLADFPEETMPVKELKTNQLRAAINPASLPFKSTNDVAPRKGAIGHQRAIQAMEFGLSNKMKGFNLFLVGEPGSGKTSILKGILSGIAKKRDIPPDWIYVYNFDDPNQPIAFSLPAGQGTQLQKDMARLVTELKRLIPKLLEGERYLKQGHEIEDSIRKKENSAFKKLQKLGRQNELHIDQVAGELLIQVIKDGRTIDHEEFEQFSAKERSYYEEKVRAIQDGIGEFLRSQRKFEREKQEKILNFQKEQILNNTADLIEELRRKYAKIGAEEDKNGKNSDKEKKLTLADWLKTAHEHIPDAFRDYQKSQEENEQQIPEGPITFHAPEFHQFRVNLFVNNVDTKGAPIVFENTPTYHNLLGRAEYQEQYGMLYTDFTLLRAGALHRANGGFLVIQISDLMKSLFGWDSLKKALRNKEVVIEELDLENRSRSTVSPRPKPIKLDTKVILIGTLEAYYFLLNMDEDFSRLFKVKAEFDDDLPRTTENIMNYAGFISRLVQEDGLRPFGASAVAKIVEHCSRLAEHQGKMSAHFINLINLVSESNYWATQESAKQVEGRHVCKAVKERAYRTGKLEFEMYEQIREGSILLDTEGLVVGQINGISIYDLGDHAFGIPSRITAKTYAGRSGILNIDREVRLAGQIHNKASLILVGILGGLYAQDRPLSLSASICFEQMYGGVEGDSASCAELFVLISSLSGVPINQGICVTGSLNQRGEVQPIGGVNEKIEGVYRIFKAKGLTGKQGVVIPVQNVINLMLDEEIVDAVAKGKFHIWPIRNVDEGIEITMGEKAEAVHKKALQRLAIFQKALDSKDNE